MLRKPDSKAPLPAFGRDDDESASTGEYKPLAHPLPSFASSDELPRFPSLVDPRELGGEALPRFPSRAEERPRAEPRRHEPVKLADLDVAATLEKKPMTARAANRILAQLDRAPQRPDETGEIALEDVLEEVYVEPAPASRRAEPRRSEPAPARSEPPPSVRHGAPPSVPVAAFSAPASRRAVAELPGSSTVPMPPVSTARPAGPAAPLPGSSTVPLPPASAAPSYPASAAPSYPPASAAPSYPASAAPSYPAAYGTHSAAAYAHTVPAGYVLVPEASLTGRDHALSAASDAALVRPLPLAVGASSLDEPKRETTVLTKVLAGGLLLGLSALAGGAASMFLLPEKAPEVPASAVAPVPVPSTPPAPASPAVSAAPAASASAAPTPSVLTPLGTGWPLAPATVPPGAASMAPPPPSGAPEGTPLPVAPPASVSAAAPASSSPPLPSHMGRIVFGPARAGHRVWIDGQMMGESDAPKVVKCGKRHVRIGSSAGGQAVDVPCGGEVTLK